MSDAIMRPVVGALTQFTKPREEYTMRDAIEWWKNCVLEADKLGGVSPREEQHLNEQWAVLAQAIADREGVGAGIVSYVLSETAQLELSALETALEEAVDAT